MGPTVKETNLLDVPFSGPSAPAITEHTANEAFEIVLAQAGASFPKRDVVDSRIVMETRIGTATYGASYGTGTGIIDTPSDVGGWPVLNSEPAPVDTDHDGIPNEWEIANGLDTNNINDGKEIAPNGYSNVENYINSLVQYNYVLRPIELKADSVSDFNVFLSWTDISDNEDGFVIERSEGSGFSVIDTAVSGSMNYIDTAIHEINEYHYRIKAFNDNMESYYSDSILVYQQFGDMFVPENLSAEIVNITNVSLTWDDISDLEQGYYIQRTTRTRFVTIDTVDADITSYIDESINDTGMYHYRIVAYMDDISSVGDTVSIGLYDPSLGIKELNQYSLPVNVYPNPFKSETNLSFELNKKEPVYIELLDVSGRKIRNIEKSSLEKGVHNFKIIGDSLKEGVYFIRIVTEKKQRTIRIVLTK